MNRLLICLVIGMAYVAVRPQGGGVPTVTPVVPSTAPVAEIAAVAKTMTNSDRKDMSDAYQTLSNALANDPEDDPVFQDTAALRRAHRAMLLCVWRGLLNNEPGKVSGLKEAVERAFDQRIGEEEVLFNPNSKQSAAKAMADIAASFK